MMKYILIIATLFALSGCGSIDRSLSELKSDGLDKAATDEEINGEE